MTLARRHFLARSGLALGALPWGSCSRATMRRRTRCAREMACCKSLHFPPRAKRVIYLFMSGGPSQLDMFDYKPRLNDENGQELPDSVRQGNDSPGCRATRLRLPLAGSIFKFGQHGEAEAWVSELLPHTAKMVDELCIVRSMYTEAINHDPAITFFQTGSQIAGRPSIGAWLSYGLGSANENLPASVCWSPRTRVASRCTLGCGGVGFCRRCIKGCSSEPEVHPCST